MLISVIRISFFGLCGLLSMVNIAAYAGDDVIRHRIVNSNFPVAAAVEVPASMSIVYLSGKLPPIQDLTQDKNSPLAYGGDTKGQTIGVLKAIDVLV